MFAFQVRRVWRMEWLRVFPYPVLRPVLAHVRGMGGDCRGGFEGLQRDLKGKYELFVTSLLVTSFAAEPETSKPVTRNYKDYRNDRTLN